MIIHPGAVTIQDNKISIDDFKMTEETLVAVARVEILTWARQEIDAALKAEDNIHGQS